MMKLKFKAKIARSYYERLGGDSKIEKILFEMCELSKFNR